MLWGSADSVRQVKAIVTLLEQGLQHLQEQEARNAGGEGGGGTPQGGDAGNGGGGVTPSPFAT